MRHWIRLFVGDAFGRHLGVAEHPDHRHLLQAGRGRLQGVEEPSKILPEFFRRRRGQEVVRLAHGRHGRAVAHLGRN